MINYTKGCIYCYLLLFIFYLYEKNLKRNRKINIYMGNSFTNDYPLPSQQISCIFKKIKYNCQFSINKRLKYTASIYNGHRVIPVNPNSSYNIVITTEKLSQNKFMKDIGEGKNKYYHLAVDYRLFSNKWHIAKPQYSKINISYFISSAKFNYGNISEFIKRKDIVYIQKVSYKNRQYIVKEIMKYIPIDSYGKDLNNKKWPNHISRRNKIGLLKQYKFCLAIENSVVTWKLGMKFEADAINDDYVTEKLLDCLLAGSIPIYFGPKNINVFLPNNDAIINLSSFSSIKNLSNYIKRIKNNVKLLEKHLKWQFNFSKEWYNRFNNDYTFNYCKICNYVKNYSLYSKRDNNN